MENNLKNIIFVLMLALLSWGAQAQSFDFDFQDRRSNRSELTLHLHDQEFRRGEVIRLKQLIRRQHPQISVRDLKIKAVTLMAKSRRGRGEASLLVDGQLSRPEFIPGHPDDFFSNRPRTYHRVTLTVPRFARHAAGPLQVQLRGNIKVKKIRLSLGGRRGGFPPRITFQHIDSMRVEKFLSTSKRFSVHSRSVAVLKLSAEKNDVQVEEVLVRFRNGEVMNAIELEGRIRENRSRELTFRAPRGRQIESVRITATAGDLFGSRGRLKLDMGVLR